MGTVHNLAAALAEGDHGRIAPRRRVLMRASVRLRGGNAGYPVTVKDISSTGLKATTPVNMFSGTHIEVDLPNIGWIQGVVVRSDEGLIAVRFGAVIDPDKTKTQVTGSYGGAPPTSVPRLSYI